MELLIHRYLFTFGSKKYFVDSDKIIAPTQRKRAPFKNSL